MANYFKYSKRWLKESLYSSRIEIFFKGIYVLFLCKVLFLWPLIDDLLYNYHQSGQGFGPLDLFQGAYFKQNPLLVKILLVSVLVVTLTRKRNYFLSLLMFLLYVSFHRAIHVIINGSDLMLSFFMFIGIFCTTLPKAREDSWTEMFQVVSINVAILLSQIQIAIMYLVSGWDKFTSSAWRNGEALFHTINIDFFAVPWVRAFLGDADPSLLQAVSWLIIGFELLFPILVWPLKSRYYVLAIGLLFHLFIGLGLSLPDFALTMIWSYLLFIRDTDFIKIISLPRTFFISLTTKQKRL